MLEREKYSENWILITSNCPLAGLPKAIPSRVYKVIKRHPLAPGPSVPLSSQDDVPPCSPSRGCTCSCQGHCFSLLLEQAPSVPCVGAPRPELLTRTRLRMRMRVGCQPCSFPSVTRSHLGEGLPPVWWVSPRDGSMQSCGSPPARGDFRGQFFAVLVLSWAPLCVSHRSGQRTRRGTPMGPPDESEPLSKQHLGSKRDPGASLVAQSLRICLPMQGTRVRALVWEDPTRRGATRPVSHNY